jgi:hypothetical protein
MRKYPLLRKGLVVGIILLFVGVAIAPNINLSVVKASKDSELIEVTTQACGIKGYGDTTVKLTREQAREVKQLFDSIKNSLDTARTKDETITIFNQAVIELNTYGLLGGLTVEQAQKLVNGPYQYSIMKKLHKELSECQTTSEYENYNCLVVGNTTVTYTLGCIGFILTRIPFLYGILFGMPIYSRPFQAFGPVVFGVCHFSVKKGNHIYAPSEGWIEADGKLGKTNFSGSFYGNIRSFSDAIAGLPPDSTTYYIGMNSYTGLILSFGETRYFLGFTPHLAITDEEYPSES